MSTHALDSLSREDLVARVRALELEVGKQASSSSRAGGAGAANAGSAGAADPQASSSTVPIECHQQALGTKELSHTDAAGAPPPKVKVPRRIVPFAEQPVRKIALLMTYEGWHYSGLAIQSSGSPQPTVEGLLLAALGKTRLIDEGAGWEGCGFSRCGRTDRGVSSAGQVLTLWIKSKRRKGDGGQPMGDDWQPNSAAAVECDERAKDVDRRIPRQPPATHPAGHSVQPSSQGSSDALEFAYPYLLNRVLPPTIRILAWAPLTDHAAFHARFSCQSRHYKYFFPRSPIAGRPPLDLGAMQAAADNLIGEHDFRNFCKVDGSKQIENHKREVVSATIAETSTAGDCVFELIGSAFLWHQVRHIIAILFLVGTGLEDPSVVTRLLHTSAKPIPSLPLNETVDGKPVYYMGAALPLQLYRCDYEPDRLDWRYGAYDGPYQALTPAERVAADSTSHSGVLSMLQGLQNQAVEARLRAQHIQSFYDVAMSIHGNSLPLEAETLGSKAEVNLHTLGAGETTSTRNYIPLMRRERLETPDKINRKWRERSGKKQAAKDVIAEDTAGEADLD